MEKITMFINKLNRFATINIDDIREYDLIRCDQCDTIINESDAIQSYNSSNNEVLLCENCCDSHYRICNRCEHHAHESLITEVENDYYCSNCIDYIDYGHCDQCNSSFYSENLYWIEREDIYLCNDCYQEYIRNNSNDEDEDNEIYTFSNDIDYPDDASIKKPYYGLEIECHSNRRYDLSCDLKFHDDILEVDTDGSLSSSEGIEIKTQPRNLDYFYTKKFKDLIDKILSYDSYTDGTKAGLHIHIDRRSMGKLTPYKFAMFMYYYKDDFIKKLSMRQDYYYCSPDINIINEYKSNLYEQTNCHKYSALNNIHRDTFELRIFKGSLRYDRIMRAIEFFESCRVYFNDCSLKNINNLNLYLDFVIKNKKRYRYLYDFIIEKFESSDLWKNYIEYKNNKIK